jgi:nucleoid DNA-binding protein
MKWTKKQLVDKIAEKADITKKEAREALNATLESIQDALSEGNSVGLVGFGTFQVRERAARDGRNPQTGDEMHIPAKNVPVFRPGKRLRDAVPEIEE